MYSQPAWPTSRETPGWWVCECEAEISDAERGSLPTVAYGLRHSVARSQGNLPFPRHFCTRSCSLRLRILSWLPPTPWNVTKQLPWEHEKSEVLVWFFNVLKSSWPWILVCNKTGRLGSSILSFISRTATQWQASIWETGRGVSLPVGPRKISCGSSDKVHFLLKGDWAFQEGWMHLDKQKWRKTFEEKEEHEQSFRRGRLLSWQWGWLGKRQRKVLWKLKDLALRTYPPLLTLEHLWVCPMHPPMSKILQRAPAKSGGKECLLRALPQGQTPGQKFLGLFGVVWDGFGATLAEEKMWLWTGAARTSLWQAEATFTSQKFCLCYSPVGISISFSSLFIEILKNHLLPEALLTSIQN